MVQLYFILYNFTADIVKFYFKNRYIQNQNWPTDTYFLNNIKTSFSTMQTGWNHKFLLWLGRSCTRHQLLFSQSLFNSSKHVFQCDPVLNYFFLYEHEKCANLSTPFVIGGASKDDAVLSAHYL